MQSKDVDDGGTCLGIDDAGVTWRSLVCPVRLPCGEQEEQW